MKRNMDLIREILLTVEKHAQGYAPSELAIEGYSREEIGYHAYLIGQAGLANCVVSTSADDTSPQAVICSLTWKGHDFIDSARDAKRWLKAKEAINQLGGASIKIWSAVLAAIIKENLGIP